ncbi:MAG: hypothetical protein ACOCVO_00670 [bacterium]
MATATRDTRGIDAVQIRLEALREHFDRYFDRGWLAMIIDDLPIDSSVVRQIRELLALPVVYADDLPEIRYGVDTLRVFATELRRHLLPVLRDRLGVSGFRRLRAGQPADDRVHRQFLCMTFPHNLRRLEELVGDLDQAARAAGVSTTAAEPAGGS